MELVLPPPPSPEVLATLARFLAAALPPVLSSLQAAAPRGEVERSLDELLRTLRLVGPLPAFKVRHAESAAEPCCWGAAGEQLLAAAASQISLLSRLHRTLLLLY